MSDQISSESLVILFIFIGLIIGFFMKIFSNKTHISYTPLMLCVGIIIGAFDVFGHISSSINMIVNISGHGFLIIFLPILLFDSAYNVNLQLFKGAIWKVFLLVGPGVIFSAVAIAIVLKPILKYADETFTWAGALSLGSVLATTDPVAVVALLKFLGAPAGLSTLIEMESLINDGTASVLFILFFEIMSGEHISAGSIAKNIFTLIIASPLLGFAFALGTHIFLKFIHRDNNNLVNLIFISIYILFYIADNLNMGTSSILASVFYGISLSALSKSHFRDEKEHVIHTVLSFCQFACETLIFYFTGILIGDRLHNLHTTNISGGDWLKMIALYLAINIIRFIMVMGSLPVQNLFGMYVSLKESIIVSYAGLRGALSLALSIIVANDERIPKETGDKFIFLTGGVVFLTLVVNGNTVSFLIKSLNIIDKPEIKNRLREKFVKNICSHSFHELKALQENRFFQVANWSNVNEYTSDQLFRKDFDNAIRFKKSQILNESHLTEHKKGSSFLSQLRNKGMDSESVLKEYRLRFLAILKNSLREGYDKFTISRRGYQIFDTSIEIELDQINTPLTIWNNLYNNFTNPKSIQYALSLRDNIFLKPFVERFLFIEIELIYEVTTSFLMLVPECLQLIDKNVGEFLNPEEIQDFENFVNEISANVEIAEFYFTNIEESFHDLITQIQTKRASIHLLHEQRNFVEENFKEGYLECMDYEIFMTRIEKKLEYLETQVLNAFLPKEIDYFLNCPYFSSLTPEEMKIVKRHSIYVQAEKGDIISEIGAPCFHLYVIIKGLVEISIVDKNQEKFSINRGMGALILLPNLVDVRDASISSAVALKDCSLFQIPISVLRKIYDANVNFKKACYQLCVMYFVKLYPEKCDLTSKWSENKIISLSYNTNLLILERDCKIQLPYGAFLYQGTLKKLREGPKEKKSKPKGTEIISKKISRHIHSFAYIPPSNQLYLARNHCELLNVGEKNLMWKKEEFGYLFKQRANAFLNTAKHKKSIDTVELAMNKRATSMREDELKKYEQIFNQKLETNNDTSQTGLLINQKAENIEIFEDRFHHKKHDTKLPPLPEIKKE